MATNMFDKFGRELRSLYALVMANIVFSGISMALGVRLGILNVLELRRMMTLLPSQIAFALIGFLVFVISLRWLIFSAETFDAVSDIKDDYEKEKIGLNDEKTTGLIVKMMAYYRNNKSAIRRMSLLSRIAGICLITNGIAHLTSNIMAETPYSLLQITGTIFCLAIGVAGVIIPHFFDNYSSVWEYRLQESVKAERELDRELEGD